MTLSDRQGHALNAALLKCDFLYSCAAVDNFSTDIMHHVVR